MRDRTPSSLYLVAPSPNVDVGGHVDQVACMGKLDAQALGCGRRRQRLTRKLHEVTVKMENNGMLHSPREAHRLSESGTGRRRENRQDVTPTR